MPWKRVDLKRQMAYVDHESQKYSLNKTERKINANGSETIRFNKSKVECYNYHKKGHFAKECMARRENRNREPIRRNVIVETIETNALVAQDGLAYDWSDQTEEGPTNFALMVYTSSGSLSSSSSDSKVSTCSKACLKSYETLKEHYDNLTKDFNKSQLNICAYKAGLESIDARLDVYKMNEVVFEEDKKDFKTDIKLRDNATTELRKKFEKAEKERDDLKVTLEKFGNSSKNLSKLLEIQVSDKLNTGVGFDSHVFDSQENDMYKTSKGYYVVPPPYTGNFMPPKYDLGNVTTARPKAVVSDNKVYEVNVVKDSACWVWIPKQKVLDHVSDHKYMTRNKSYLLDYKEIYGGFVAFGGDPKGGRITGKKNSVLFTDTECVVLSPDFKLTDESHVLLKVPRKDNMYSVDLKNVVPQGGLTCLFAKATPDESNLWHRRLGHVNFKTMNKLVRGNLVRGLPSKLFEINQTCVACQKGKQHRASCKTKTVSSISQPLQMLHMDLFGPTFVKSLMKKMYCLVVTDDFSRFSWVFFLATKDETSEILKTFITGIENLIDLRVKVIRCDNGTEFKNRVMNQFCEMKGIKREFSVARTPQQNGVAERKNRTLIEAARTMLVDSKLPTTFWAEAVNTACYVQNRVLVIKPHNKTPYELFLGRKPALSFMRPFGCPVTILNTIDHLGKFDGKADEGFFVGYSTNSKAFRVFNSRTRIVEENLHVQFSENTPNIAGSGPNWLFDIDALTKSMNYKPVVAGNQSNGNAGTKACDNAGKARVETVPGKDYILLSLWTQDPPFSSSTKDSLDARFKPSGEEEKKDTEEPEKKVDNVVDENIVSGCADDPNMSALEEIVYLDNDEDIGAEADMNNLDAFVPVSPIPTTRVHKDHPLTQVIGYLQSSTLTRSMSQDLEEHGLFSSAQQRTNHKDLQNYFFDCFLSQEEPKKIVQALKDLSWIEAMQEELLQFKLQEV
ncbi:putative ribonuclease H-like domain-containing protein [Tanacetum coccineum]